MKKLLTLVAIALFATANMNAQGTGIIVPADCQNSGFINGIVSSELAQGWKATNFAIAVIDYLVQPDPPYKSGFVTITFVPDCEPLEPCPAIAKAINVDMVVINNNGTCVYKHGDF